MELRQRRGRTRAVSIQEDDRFLFIVIVGGRFVRFSLSLYFGNHDIPHFLVHIDPADQYDVTRYIRFCKQQLPPFGVCVVVYGADKCPYTYYPNQITVDASDNKQYEAIRELLKTRWRGKDKKV